MATCRLSDQREALTPAAPLSSTNGPAAETLLVVTHGANIQASRDFTGERRDRRGRSEAAAAAKLSAA